MAYQTVWRCSAGEKLGAGSLASPQWFAVPARGTANSEFVHTIVLYGVIDSAVCQLSSSEAGWMPKRRPNIRKADDQRPVPDLVVSETQLVIGLATTGNPVTAVAAPGPWFRQTTPDCPFSVTCRSLIGLASLSIASELLSRKRCTHVIGWLVGTGKERAVGCSTEQEREVAGKTRLLLLDCLRRGLARETVDWDSEGRHAPGNVNM